MGKVVGIDLGTTNSEVAVMEGGRPVVITNAEGEPITPSVVSFIEGVPVVGVIAKRRAISHPKETVRSVKRRMGSTKRFRVGGKLRRAEELSSYILKKLKTDAEAYLGEPVTQAVITVPAYFEDAQRQATKDAGELAGLEVLRIVNEPTAACLAYGIGGQGGGRVLVFDFGGGTLDVSILEVNEGVYEVIATAGNNHLGGDDFDDAIIRWLIEKVADKAPGAKDDLGVQQRLKEAAEKAKIELSTKEEVRILLPMLCEGERGPVNIDANLARAEFEGLCTKLFDKARIPLRRALADANLSPADLDHILLVGGTTRMPAVRRIIEEELGKSPESNVDPDLCVAMGAAVQAGVLMGTVPDILLVDVTPLSLGVELLGDEFYALIPRNSRIPTKVSKIFSTATDNQSSVEVHILQGERPLASQNISLGRFHLRDIPPAPRGVPQIEVTFAIDANGIVQVTAVDLATGNEQGITVTGSKGMSKDEIQALLDEAAAHAEEDKANMERVEGLYRAQAEVVSVERAMKAAKLPSEKRVPLAGALMRLKRAIGQEDLVAVERELGRLREVVEPMKEVLESALADAEAPPAPGPPPGERGASPTTVKLPKVKRRSAGEPEGVVVPEGEMDRIRAKPLREEEGVGDEGHGGGAISDIAAEEVSKEEAPELTVADNGPEGDAASEGLAGAEDVEPEGDGLPGIAEKSPEELAREKGVASLMSVPGMTVAYANDLYHRGFQSFETLTRANLEDIRSVTGMSKSEAESILDYVARISRSKKAKTKRRLRR